MKKDALAVRFRKGLRQWAAVLPFITVGLVLFITFVLYPQIKNIYIALCGAFQFPACLRGHV